MYRKYQNDELYTDSIQWSENLPYYLTKVRPDMLKMFQFLNRGIAQKSGLPKPITLDNGKVKMTLDNSCYWFSGLLLDYLKIYLGVDPSMKKWNSRQSYILELLFDTYKVVTFA